MESSDFLVESEGNCFLCWDRAQQTTHSLHFLARYLRMDMKKVFSDEGPIPKQLLDKVDRSKLKVELCEDCSNMTEKFSALCRQLEKIQMEVTSYLDSIQERLERGVEKTGKTIIQSDAKNEPWGQLKIVQVLRLEALHKCSRKLTSSSPPRIKAKNMTPQQITAAKLKINKTEVEEDSEMKVESVFSTEGASDDDHDGSNFLDKEGVKGEACTEIPPDESVDEPEPKINLEQAMTSTPVKADAVKVPKLTSSVPDATKSFGKAGKIKYRFDPASGKFKCQLCSKEYGSEWSCKNHFRIVHLSLKHVCGLCKKSFTNKASHDRHYLNSHMGVRFKCTQYDKIFSDKSQLMRHQQTVHLGKRLSCQFCSKTFSQSGHRNVHLRMQCTLNPNSVSYNLNI